MGFLDLENGTRLLTEAGVGLLAEVATGPTPPTPIITVVPAVGFLSGASPKVSPTFDVLSGDLILIQGAAENGTTTMGAPTWDGSGSVTSLVSIGTTTNEPKQGCWKIDVTADATGRTISMTGATGQFAFVATVWRGCGGLGTPSTQVLTSPATGLAAVTVNTTQDNSAVSCVIDDWAAIDGASRVWQTINGAAMTETVYQRNTTNYGVYAARRGDAGAAGAKTVGLSSPSGMTYGIIALEIKGV